MRLDRHLNMERCLLVVAQLCDMQEDGYVGVGVGEIRNYTRLSRQTVNSIMKQACQYGYAVSTDVIWRKDNGSGDHLLARRYRVSPFWERTYRKAAARRVTRRTGNG